MKSIHLLLTLSVLSVPLLSFAKDDLFKTVETLEGCTKEKLSTPAGQQECFSALGKVQEDTTQFQTQIDALQPQLKALADKRTAASAKAKLLINQNTKLSALPSVGKGKSQIRNSIPSKLGEMWSALNRSEQSRMETRMIALGMPNNIQELTYAQLDKLMNDKSAKKILGCGIINEDECDTWQSARRYIDINRKSLLTRAQGEVDSLQVEHETLNSKLERLKDAHKALGGFDPSTEAGNFFEDLNDLGMLSKFALMSSKQLTDELNLGKAQLDVLKEKLGNSILGIVMNEKIEEALKKPMDELRRVKGEFEAHKAEIALMQAAIQELKAKACGNGTETNTLCMSAAADQGDRTEGDTTGGTGGGSPSSGDGVTNAKSDE